jgi:hypothetical protein
MTNIEKQELSPTPQTIVERFEHENNDEITSHRTEYDVDPGYRITTFIFEDGTEYIFKVSLSPEKETTCNIF